MPAIKRQFRHVSGSYTVVGRSLSPVRRRGTHCRNVHAILPAVLLFLTVYSKHSFLSRHSIQSTNVCSALEALALAMMHYINLRLTLHDTHTHTHPFNGPLSRTTLDFTEARDSEWQWHQLGRSLCKSASRSRQIPTPAPQHSVFTGRMPFLPPNQQRQSTEGILTLHDYTKLHPCLYLYYSSTGIVLTDAPESTRNAV